jgi:methyl-accepting chemotaxis protein
MNSSILKKLAWLTLAGLALVAVVGGAAWVQFNRVVANQTAALIATAALRDHMEADMMHDALRADVLSALHAAAVKESASAADVRADLAEHAKHLRDSLEANKRRGLSPQAATAMNATATSVADYVTSAEQLVALAVTDPAAAEAGLPGFLKTFGDLEGKLAAVSDAIEEDNQTSERASRAAIVQFKIVLLLAVSLGSFALLALAFVVARSIPRPFQQIVTELSHATEVIKTSAAEVAQINQSLAAGASEQAASLEETSASLEEISSMTQRNAQNAQSAKAFTTQTKAAAASGVQSTRELDQAMHGIRAAGQEMRDAMNGIKAASNDVSKIIKTIDEIAFQTNILALNAAVEAARAGEAGMGFAVVADEVRNLAQRSATAARETTAMIEASIKRSEDGVRVTEKVTGAVAGVAACSQHLAEKLAEILAKVHQVDEQVAQIAAASLEQSQGIGEVNMAVSQMDKVTQTNAASAEESAASAEELNAQAEVLKGTVHALQNLVGRADQTSAPQIAKVESARVLPPAARLVASKSTGAAPRAAGASGPVAVAKTQNRELVNFQPF